MKSLQEHITRKSLQALAGRTIYARGLRYFETNRVNDLRIINNAVHAAVEGTSEYKVTLRTDTEGLAFACSCPMGDSGECCKHVVAAGLAWLEQRHANDGGGSMQDDTQLVRDYLHQQTRETLDGWLLAQCDEDPALHRELAARAMSSNSRQDIKKLKAVVRDAFAFRGFVSYQRLREIMRRVQSVFDLIEGLIRDRHAPLAAKLADYAMQRGISTYTQVDDSGGSFGDLLHTLGDLHLRAHREASPDQTLTAKTFFKLKRMDEWDFFALIDYGPLLADRELKQYRALAEKEWAKVPQVRPGEADRYSFSEHYNITAIMEELARYDDDIDGLVAIKRRELAGPYDFLQIADVLHTAGRDDDALAWAERGMESFPDCRDRRLIEFLVGAYQRRQRYGDAVTLAWKQFQQQASLAAYKLLQATAKKAKDWPARKERALAHLHSQIEKQRLQKTTNRGWEQPGQIVLMDIHLWENDVDGAMSTAKSLGAIQEQWLRLARACKKDQPAEAAAIYRNRLDHIVNLKHNDAYDEAADMVKTVRKLMQRAKQEGQFDEWLAGVRTQHRAKRNFMQRLDTTLAKK